VEELGSTGGGGDGNDPAGDAGSRKRNEAILALAEVHTHTHTHIYKDCYDLVWCLSLTICSWWSLLGGEIVRELAEGFGSGNWGREGARFHC
jgi:hypothetical protein